MNASVSGVDMRGSNGQGQIDLRRALIASGGTGIVNQWQRLEVSQIRELTRDSISAVYMIYSGDELLYIGQTNWLRSRLLTHLRETEHPTPVSGFPRSSLWVKYLLCVDREKLERQLITSLNPICNVVSGKPKQKVIKTLVRRKVAKTLVPRKRSEPRPEPRNEVERLQSLMDRWHSEEN